MSRSDPGDHVHTISKNAKTHYAHVVVRPAEPMTRRRRAKNRPPQARENFEGLDLRCAAANTIDVPLPPSYCEREWQQAAHGS